MQTRFNLRKTAQAAALLLKLRGGRMSYLKLIKLLYLLDRSALERWYRPVTGDHYVSMKLGPVLSNVRDLIVWEPLPDEQDAWHDLIGRSGPFDVVLRKEVEPDTLSPKEIELIQAIFQEFGGMDRWTLAEYTHRLPEWKPPEQDNSAAPLEYEAILEAVGHSPEEASEICREIEDVNRVASLLNAQ